MKLFLFPSPSLAGNLLEPILVSPPPLRRTGPDGCDNFNAFSQPLPAYSRSRTVRRPANVPSDNVDGGGADENNPDNGSQQPQATATTSSQVFQQDSSNDSAGDPCSLAFSAFSQPARVSHIIKENDSLKLLLTPKMCQTPLLKLDFIPLAFPFSKAKKPGINFVWSAL